MLSGIRTGATVAMQKAFDYVQPDGSTIRIRLHGDEFHHWATSSDGKTVMKLGTDGFYRPAGGKAPAEPASAAVLRKRAGDARLAAARSQSISLGEHRFLIILVQFADLSFTIDDPVQSFRNLLNQQGYSDNGATGSVFDYFSDSSRGQFVPQFDVVGPYTVSGNMADYGGNGNNGDKDPFKCFFEACQLADADVDFSIYDCDGDGTVDNIFFYYAGHNEAEGGVSSSIWPHSSSLSYYYGSYRFDGVKLGTYACSSEYKGGYWSNTMCGIGTFCHEFGHVLGLPDFYDTDYSENGQCDPLMDFSLMSSGNYNNDGRTPPYLSAVERNLLGWMDEPEEITGEGSFTLPAIHENKAFTTATENPGEYFLYEVRDGSGWDKFIGKGMLAYHVDKSNNNVHGISARNRWDSWNRINAYADHPCYRIIKASKSGDGDNVPYPGSGNVRTFCGKSWAGYDSELTLNNITWADGTVSFMISCQPVKILTGRVRDVMGDPLSGASLSLFRQDGSHAGSATSDASGAFTFDISEDKETLFTLTARMEGYLDRTETVPVPGNTVNRDVTLHSVWDGEPLELYKFGADSGRTFGWGKGVSIRGSVRFSADELAESGAVELRYVSFKIADGNASSVKVFVESNGDKLFEQQVTAPVFGGWNTVELGRQSVLTSGNSEITVGVTVTSPEGAQPLCVDNGPWTEGGGYVSSLSSHNWQSTANSGNLLIKGGFGTGTSSLRQNGFSVIRRNSDGSFTVVPGRGLSIIDVKWTENGSSVVAEVTYSDGTSETLEAE